MTTWKDVAAVEYAKFREWAVALIEDTKDLRANDRKLLLIYDGYRSHLSIHVLEKFRDAGMIAHALPAFTIGRTQPFDMGVFSPFKTHFGSLVVQCASGRAQKKVYDEFNVCKVLIQAYEISSTAFNIKAGFRRSGIIPLDKYALFAQARPHSHGTPTKISTVDDMAKMLDEEKKRKVSEILGDVTVRSQGFLDTSYGAVVTSEATLALLRLYKATKERAALCQKRKEKETLEKL